MKSDVFQFQHFSVRHDRASMKVGTDGVLLGAWCHVNAAHTALDVGTGSGLIALMIAQRSTQLQHILGIDIDKESVQQANENFAVSPFSNRLSALTMDFSLPTFAANSRFDLIVSNPPFFTEQTASPSLVRDRARRSESLPLHTLLQNAATLLSPTGHVSLILPYQRSGECVATAVAHGLHLCRRTDVRQRNNRDYVRSLLEFSFTIAPTVYDTLTLTDDSGQRSAQYQQLTHDFYIQ